MFEGFFLVLLAPYVCFHISNKVKVTEWPPIGRIAAHSAYDMFLGVSAWLLVWSFPTSVFGVGVSFWLRLFLIFAYLYLFIDNQLNF